MRLPNFFIVGAPKAGTTSLYEYLGQHPQIYMSPLKEPHYFASEFRPENFSPAARSRALREIQALRRYLQGDVLAKRFGGLVLNWEDYLKLFGNAAPDQLALGEATPCYLWSPSAPGNIRARIPHARIIINLRNPADRAYSQYLHMLTAGATRRTFRQQIEESLRPARARPGSWWQSLLLEFGHYSEQVQRYRNEFPESQIHVSLYEDLECAPQTLVSSLFAFLGVDPKFVTDVSDRHHQPRIPKLTSAAYFLKKWQLWPHLRALAPAPVRRRLASMLLYPRSSLTMRPEDRAFLRDYYRDDINKLATLLNRDLTSWLHSAG